MDVVVLQGWKGTIKAYMEFSDVCLEVPTCFVQGNTNKPKEWRVAAGKECEWLTDSQTRPPHERQRERERERVWSNVCHPCLL
jgi:hypothetical protein